MTCQISVIGHNPDTDTVRKEIKELPHGVVPPRASPGSESLLQDVP